MCLLTCMRLDLNNAYYKLFDFGFLFLLSVSLNEIYFNDYAIIKMSDGRLL